MLPIAAASHVRLVLLNRRGYRGCTPLGESETAAQASPELYETFLRKRAKELATFLVKFIELEGIPPISQQGGTGRASGGISLAGWSLGNIQVSAVLAYADTFESGLVGGLSTHLRKVVQYGACVIISGVALAFTSRIQMLHIMWAVFLFHKILGALYGIPISQKQSVQADL